MNFNSLLQKYKKRQSNEDSSEDAKKTRSDTTTIDDDALKSRNDDIHTPLENEKVVDFLIIGVQKGGTMSVVKNLNKHPEIFVKSECQFFTFCWDFGLEWYKSQLVTEKKIIGEKTPEIIYCDDCAPKVKKICPNAKFILFLRDPVLRAYSSWNMQKTSKKVESLTFEESVERELNHLMGERRTFGTAEFHYIQRGFYMDQIERFQKHFPDRNQMLIVVSERMRLNPSKTYSEIFEFLGASEFKCDHYEDDHIGDYHSALSDKMKSKLKTIYQPHNERLFEFLGYRIEEWE